MNALKLFIPLLFICLFLLNACGDSYKKKYHGFVYNTPRKDKNHYLSVYPKEIDSVITDLFIGKYLEEDRYHINDRKVYYSQMKETYGEKEREYLDTTNYTIRVDYLLNNEKHRANFMLNKQFKIKLILFPQMGFKYRCILIFRVILHLI